MFSEVTSYTILKFPTKQSVTPLLNTSFPVMSVTSFIAGTDARITPVSVAFEAAAATMIENSKPSSSGVNVFSCVAKVASSIAAQLTGTGAVNEQRVSPQQEHKDTKVFALEEIDNDDDYANHEVSDARHSDIETTNISNALGIETENARKNWIELWTRVQTVDPRVFDYETDPKYLQQCAEAKQRRASLTPICPVWQP